MRAVLGLGLCALAFAACGGDDEDEGERQPPATAPVTTQATQPEATGTSPEEPEPEPTVESPEDAPGGAGDEEPVRSEAVFTGDAGRITPARIEVPAYIAVRIRLLARDREPYVLEIAGRSLRPGDTLDLDGLRPGQRLVGSANGRRVVVSATAEPGP